MSRPMGGEKPVELALMIRRQVDKRNAGSVGEFWLVFKVDDLASRADGTAINDDSELIGLARHEHGARLDLHATATQVRGLPNSQFVKADKGNGAVDVKPWISAFFFLSINHVRLRVF